MTHNIDAALFMYEIKKFVQTGHITGAIRFCKNKEHSALARVVKAGLSRAN